MLTVQCAMVHLLLDCLKYASTLCGHCINQSGTPIETIYFVHNRKLSSDILPRFENNSVQRLLMIWRNKRLFCCSPSRGSFASVSPKFPQGWCQYTAQFLFHYRKTQESLLQIVFKMLKDFSHVFSQIHSESFFNNFLNGYVIVL